MAAWRLTKLTVAALAMAGAALASQPASASTTKYAYDALGRLLTVTYGNGVIVNYTYDAAGNRTQKTVVLGPNLGGGTKVVVLPRGGFFVLPLR